MSNMKRSTKITLAVLSIILILFIIYNIVWGILVQKKYGRFIVGMEEIHTLQTYVIPEKDGYTYIVKIPDYLRFIGNLGVQPSGGGEAALLVWPGIFKDTEYGVFLPTEEGSMHAVRLTKDRLPLENAPEDIWKLVEQNRETIDTLFEKAEEQWGELE